MQSRFNFAWVDEGDTTFSPTFARVDEPVFDLNITHNEGEFPTATVEVKRPTTGLLNPSRKLYVWISATRDGTHHPLFFGRVTGFPKALGSATVSLELVGQFPGWEANRTALFNGLKALPYWDPAFIDPQRLNDPQMALESRPALYHYDRLSGVVSLSNILEGSETITLQPMKEPFTADIAGQTARRCNVTATVEWEQVIRGVTHQANKAIMQAFQDGRISTFTPETIETGWPQVGETFGGDTGYEVFVSQCFRLNNLASERPRESEAMLIRVPDDERAIIKASTGKDQQRRPGKIARTWFDTKLGINYAFRQKRRETIQFTVQNDVQPLSWGASDQVDINVTLQGEDVVDLGLQTQSFSSYFINTRGQQSFRYLLAVAKANLAAAARAVDITFDVPFWDGLDLSCDKSVTIAHPTLPGGTATGKVTSYTLARTAGSLRCTVQIGVSVGNGNSYSPSGLVDDYVTGDTLTSTTQLRVGEENGGTGLEDMIFQTFTTQVPPTTTIEMRALWGNVINGIEIENPPEEQQAHLTANQFPVRDNLDGVVNEVPTRIRLDMASLSASDEVDHLITVEMAHPYTPIMGIDLAAS